MNPEILTRFLAKVVIPDDVADCWIWTAWKSTGGYGKFRVGDRIDYAHRVAYQHFVGEVQSGLEIDHTCHNDSGCLGGKCVHRLCVNPAHLEAVLHLENSRRGEGLSGRRFRQTHCKYGHEFTPENTYVRKRNEGGRTCRACKRVG